MNVCYCRGGILTYAFCSVGAAFIFSDHLWWDGDLLDNYLYGLQLLSEHCP